MASDNPTISISRSRNHPAPQTAWPTFHFRRARLDDVPAIESIESRCFTTPWPAREFIRELTSNPLAIYVVCEVFTEAPLHNPAASTPGKGLNDRPATAHPATAQPGPDQPDPDQPVPDRISLAHPAPDHLPHDQSASRQQLSPPARPATAHPAPDQLDPDHPATAQPLPSRPALDHPAFPFDPQAEDQQSRSVIAGYAGLWAIAGEGHITNIAVHPNRRRCGVASGLLETLFHLAGQRDVDSYTLEVRPSNEAAIRLYKRYGFEIVGRRKGYYGDDGEDAAIMWNKTVAARKAKAQKPDPVSRRQKFTPSAEAQKLDPAAPRQQRTPATARKAEAQKPDPAARQQRTPATTRKAEAQKPDPVSRRQKSSPSAEAQKPDPAARQQLLTLAIETSCDETSVAIVRGGRTVLSNIISSQIEIHQVFGGVVPEIASRHHLTNINPVLEEALKEAGVSLQQLDLIGVTKGPGLIGAVLIGLSTAKALAFALQKPFVGVHHIQGHICAAFLEHPDLAPPFLALIVSGGHTDLIEVRSYQDFHVLGRTRDDAVGEAFDKVARVLGLGYPGGPLVDAAARTGDPEKIMFKRVMLEKDSLDFSFSGVKTAVLNYINTEKQAGRPIPTDHIAAGFQASVMDVIVAKTLSALRRTGHHKLVVGGGVAANTLLRNRLTQACADSNIRLYVPSPVYCTDNAAMIACAAHYDFVAGRQDDLSLDAAANLPLPSRKKGP